MSSFITLFENPSRGCGGAMKRPPLLKLARAARSISQPAAVPPCHARAARANGAAAGQGSRCRPVSPLGPPRHVQPERCDLYGLAEVAEAPKIDRRRCATSAQTALRFWPPPGGVKGFPAFLMRGRPGRIGCNGAADNQGGKTMSNSKPTHRAFIARNYQADEVRKNQLDRDRRRLDAQGRQGLRRDARRLPHRRTDCDPR